MLPDRVISVFKKLIEEEIFGENSEEITYFISTTDGDYIYELENYSAKLFDHAAHNGSNYVNGYCYLMQDMKQLKICYGFIRRLGKKSLNTVN